MAKYRVLVQFHVEVEEKNEVAAIAKAANAIRWGTYDESNWCGRGAQSSAISVLGVVEELVEPTPSQVQLEADEIMKRAQVGVAGLGVVHANLERVASETENLASSMMGSPLGPKPTDDVVPVTAADDIPF